MSSQVTNPVVFWLGSGSEASTLIDWVTYYGRGFIYTRRIYVRSDFFYWLEQDLKRNFSLNLIDSFYIKSRYGWEVNFLFYKSYSSYMRWLIWVWRQFFIWRLLDTQKYFILKRLIMWFVGQSWFSKLFI